MVKVGVKKEKSNFFYVLSISLSDGVETSSSNIFQVCKVCPNDRDARAKYTQCKKIVQEQAFARAIAVESKTKSVCDDLHLEAMGEAIFAFSPLFFILFHQQLMDFLAF